MNRILLIIGTTAGSLLGWWIGSFVGLMTAYIGSILFALIGIYLARIIMTHYFE